jgi:formylglycine-generating enzyme required for sulfatase activity/serine/threonine protein phosphatase PrpC
LYFEVAGNQIDGSREYQEDAFLTTHVDAEDADPKSRVLAVVADGMGGHAAGNIASNIVVSTIKKQFIRQFGKQDTAHLLRASLLDANEALKDAIRQTPALEGMGCTMVATALAKGKLSWVSVGDSHLYLLRDRQLLKKNEDHSYGGYIDRMKAQGLDVEPEPSLSRNMLMSALTGDEIAEIDCPDKPFQLLPGDRVIIASDGLDTLTPATILQFSAWSKTAKECVDALLKAVEDAGIPRQDNTTVLVVDALDREATLLSEEAPAKKAGSYRGDTQPFSVDEIEEAAVAGTTRPREAVVPARPAAGRAAVGRKGVGLGIAAVVVIGVAIAAYWLRQTDTSQELSAASPAHEPAAQPGRLAETEQVRPQPAAREPHSAASVPPSAALPESASEPAPETERVVESATESAEQQLALAPTTTAQPPAGEVGAPRVLPTSETAFRDVLSDGTAGPVMVRIPQGTFAMGSPSVSVIAEERPEHLVKIDSFAMSQYEVSFAEYEQFARATRRKMPSDLSLARENHPVVLVSWDDVHAYTQWLSRQTGARYRLPSEAEWEYAAAAGSDAPYWWGFDVGKNKAHCFGCETGLDPRKPTSVGRFEPNAFGLYDMLGNVMEWVYDCYHANYLGAPDDGSVWEGGDCNHRVVRGGAYTSPPPSIRVMKRDKRVATERYDTVGIRLVRDL